ncbi:cyclin-T1-3-like isoform X3 [Prosopis cineraria]|uniref:cyclin-T1-3-like isoform X3 n=1 Tax=Prosopis cineraria TaxID=364024 RepID=UPI00240EF9B9|nr:cyclin-T1-3-like isoform X3 [Prosopis cineraria]
MAGFLPGDVTCNGTHGFQRHPEMSVHGPGWYFTRKEIEENSPSKRDGVDWKKEMYFRKSYCTFLQDLGMRLKLPQVTIATAIIFCHRFFLRHSLARNDRKTIATACMFLAGKVEETPRPLKDVTLVSYEITNKKDHEAAQRIKQKEVYEQQKDLILAGERIVLQTLEVSNQMLELYEQNRVPPSNDIEGATGSGTANRAAAKVPASNDENAATNNNSHTGATSLKLETSKPGASKTVFGSSGNHVGLPVSNHGRSTDYGGREMKHRADESSGNHHLECETLPHKENLQEAQHKSRSQSGNGEEQESSVERSEMKEAAELNAKHANRDPDHRDSTFGQPPQEAIKKIDRDRVKAALEKRRKTSGHITKKTEVMDDDDLIERELEDGIELAAQSEKNKQDRSQIWSKPSDRSNNGNLLLGRHQDHADEHLQGVKSLASSEPDLSTIEEGEVSALDDIGSGLQSPKSGNRKRKAGSSPDRELEGRPHSPYYSFDYAEDRNKVSQLSHSEGDN